MMEKKPGILVGVGTGVLIMVWLWLAWLFISAKGVTLFNLIILAMTGIICFVPIYKKYFSGRSDNKKK